MYVSQSIFEHYDILVGCLFHEQAFEIWVCIFVHYVYAAAGGLVILFGMWCSHDKYQYDESENRVFIFMIGWRAVLK